MPYTLNPAQRRIIDEHMRQFAGKTYGNFPINADMLPLWLFSDIRAAGSDHEGLYDAVNRYMGDIVSRLVFLGGNK